ncbi:TPA: hypothetical protein H1595_002341 [Listeria monocytogenes]|nr:hypothetical protein [Listeria monocytogenes]HAK1345205.1 hypothetical protein [Listeria monocytogenes]
MEEVVLSESDIQSIINGRDVVKKLSEGTIINIRKSYLKDAVAPSLIDRFNVSDREVEKAKETYHHSAGCSPFNDTFQR